MQTKSTNITEHRHHLDENTRTLSFIFKVLSLSGVWLPLHWESRKYEKIAYHVFSAIVILSFYIMVGLQITLLASSKLQLNFFIDIMFTLSTAISCCFKMMHFLVRRKQVIQLREMLMEEWYMPRDNAERQMQRKMNDFIKNCTIAFNFITQVTLFFQLITPLFQESSSRKLPFRIWLPYDLDDRWNFWIVYGLEVMPMFFAVLVNANIDLIVSSFVLRGCAQLDLLKYRFNRLPDIVKSKLRGGLSADELLKNSLKQLVLHHDFVIKFTKNITKTFDVIIVELYVASVLTISIIVYQFTLGEIPPLQKIMAFGYIVCMCGELLAYFWSGNELTLKSSELGEEIYKMDWMLLNKETNKTLRFIMLRTSVPIVMSYSGLIIVNIDSFKTIIKITYTAFNVLRNFSV